MIMELFLFLSLSFCHHSLNNGEIESACSILKTEQDRAKRDNSL